MDLASEGNNKVTDRCEWCNQEIQHRPELFEFLSEVSFRVDY